MENAVLHNRYTDNLSCLFKDFQCVSFWFVLCLIVPCHFTVSTVIYRVNSHFQCDVNRGQTLTHMHLYTVNSKRVQKSQSSWEVQFPQGLNRDNVSFLTESRVSLTT